MNNYIIDFNKICDLIQDAHGAGFNANIVINGEYYEINPETIPETIKNDID